MQKFSIIRSQAVKSALVGLVATLIPVMVPGWALNSHAAPDTPITISNITITAPVAGATPVSSTTSNGQYTTTITWNGSPSTFATETVYTATVVVTPDSGFTLTGLAPNFFTVNGGTTTPKPFVASTFGTTGDAPFFIAIDSSNNVYTANNNDDNVTKITPQGVSTIFGTTGDRPHGIAIDSLGNVYTSNLGSNNVTKITPQGVSSIFGATGGDPYFIAIDSSNNVYTANYSDNNVTKITPQGVSSIFGATDAGPYGIAIDSLGNVYTANWDAKNLTKITPGGVTSNFGQTGLNPTGLVIDSFGNFYTANWGDSTVSKITPEDTSTTFGTTGEGPYSIAIDSSGNIYTPNEYTNDVTKITPEGISSTLSTTGSAPVAIAFDSVGNLYTANWGSDDVTKITYVGEAGFSYEFPATGGGPQPALNPSFGTPTSTADGFTVSINNYDPDFTWATPTVTAGSVSNWSTSSNSSGSRVWLSIASDAYGTKLAAVENVGYIYTSTDSGVTWSKQEGSGSRAWRSITSSDDGTKLAAAVSGASGGYIYTSTDSGVTWTERQGPGSREWRSIASNDDGTSLAAVSLDGYIYTSNDSGATWTERSSGQTRNYRSITISNDGGVLAVVVQNGYIYTSVDSGVTWTERRGAGSRPWRWIASDGYGQKLAAVSNRDIYTSTDLGATWIRQTGVSSNEWRSITSSDDGTKLAAVEENGYIYTSTDSGVTWSQQTVAGSREWRSIASTNDGAKLAAVVLNDYIYTWSPTLLTVTGLAQGASATITQTTSRVGYNNGSRTVTGSASAGTTISIGSISIAAPVTGAAPVSSITSNGEYTASISWSGAPSTFAGNTAYTATITITPAAGYTLSGIGSDFFSVAGATVTHASDSATFTAVFPTTGAKLTQTISFTQPSAMTMVSSDQALSVTSSAGGSYPVAIASTTPAVCTIVDGAIHVVAAGTCSITATQAGDGAYEVAKRVNRSIQISKLAQTITFTQPGAMSLSSSDQALVATSSATGSYPVSFTATPSGVCSIVDGAIHAIAAGTCSITASQAGDAIYSAARNVIKTITVTTQKQAQTINFTQPAAMSMTTADQALVATSSAGGSYPVSFASRTPSVCTIVDGAIHVVAAGTCSITASQAGDGAYFAATSVVKSIAITKLTQTITFTQPAAMSMTTSDQELVATSSATGSYPVSFTSTTPSICTIVDGAIHVVAAGTCSITATQTGDGTYSAATAVVKSIVISKVTQSISFTQPSDMAKTSSDQALVATSSAGDLYPVSFASTTTGVCTIVNGAIHVVAGGICSITASRAGDGIYLPASNVVKTIKINKLTQSISFNQPTAMSTLDADQALVATSNATGSYPVSFASTTTAVCTIVNGAIHAVAGGTCSITASQAGDGTYWAASSVVKSIAIKQPQSTLTILNSNVSNIAKGTRGITLSSSFGSGNGAVSYSVSGAGCSYNSSTRVLSVAASYQPSSNTSCTVTATKAAHGIYLVSTSTAKIFTFGNNG